MSVETGLSSLSLSIFVLNTILVLFLVRNWIIARRISDTLEIINRNLPAIMQNLEEMVSSANSTAHTVQAEVEAITAVTRRIHGTIGLVAALEHIIRGKIRVPVVSVFSTAFAIAKGIRVFFYVLRKARRREDGNG
ncbi:MAG: hypothetical protein L7F78_12025 [Syntrophales bacterium LBB04]|nr:hypothetical protein [Syntrophales bacterium LBB04]